MHHYNAIKNKLDLECAQEQIVWFWEVVTQHLKEHQPIQRLNDYDQKNFFHTFHIFKQI